MLKQQEKNAVSVVKYFDTQKKNLLIRSFKCIVYMKGTF